MTTTIQQMVDAVKAHAVKNYEQDGWDYIVECWEDSEIEQELVKENCQTVVQALYVFADIGNLFDSRRREVMAEIF
jgi:hypothetical protein